MKPPPLRYGRARSVADCLTLLADAVDDEQSVKFLAGGQSLLPLLSLGLSTPTHLVDVGGVRELDDVQLHGDAVTVGALVRHSRLASDPLVRTHLPVLARAAEHIGHEAIRHRGTLGGSLAHADPAAELPATLAVLRATVVCLSAAGTRRIPAVDFVVGPYMTALREDELLAWVEIPVPRDVGHGFVEFAARHGDYARAGAVCRIQHLAGAVGAIDAVLFATSTRPLDVGRHLEPTAGRPIADVDWAAVARTATTDVPIEKRRLATTVLARALQQAAAPPLTVATGRPRGRAGLSIAPGSAPAPPWGEQQDIAVTVNGERCTDRVPARLTLADYLRERRGLVGTHVGCEQGVCGSCTVLVDGVSMRSCLMLAPQAHDRHVRTVEGLAAADDALHPLQEAFDRRDALQCGFCTPGFLMTGVELLQRDGLDEGAVRSALSGNLCRCTGYEGIVSAVLEVHATRRAAAAPVPRPRKLPRRATVALSTLTAVALAGLATAAVRALRSSTRTGREA